MWGKESKWAMTKIIFRNKKRKTINTYVLRMGYLLQWQRSCLACPIPWVYWTKIPTFFPPCHIQKVFLQKPAGMQSSMSFKFSKVLIITSIILTNQLGSCLPLFLEDWNVIDHKGFFPECLSVSFMMSFMSTYFHVVRIFFIHLNRVLK